MRTYQQKFGFGFVFYLALCITICRCGTTVGNGGGGNTPTTDVPTVTPTVPPTNPSSGITLGYKSYTSSSRGFIETQATDTATSIIVCIKRIKFKAAESSTTSDLEISVGETTLKAAGASIVNTTLEKGNYTRVEIEISNSTCTSRKAIQVTNSHGSFSTEDGITLRFDGQFSATDSAKTIDLNVQSFVTAMEQLTSSDHMKDNAEAAIGECTER